MNPDWKIPPHRQFIDFERLKGDDVKHIQVLATISDLATELPAELGREIQKGVATQMQAFGAKLGGDVSISQYEAGKK